MPVALAASALEAVGRKRPLGVVFALGEHAFRSVLVAARCVELRWLFETLLHRLRAAVGEVASIFHLRIQQARDVPLDWLEARCGVLQVRNRPEQSLRVGVYRTVEDIFEMAALDDFAGVHHPDARTHPGDNPQIVGYHHDAHVLFALEVPEEIQDLGLDGDVERRRRFVRDQYIRFARERLGDHRALEHPTRKLVWVLLDALFGVRDAHLVEEFDRSRTTRLAHELSGGKEGAGDELPETEPLGARARASGVRARATLDLDGLGDLFAHGE